VPAQPVDATPPNTLIRQSFPGRSDPFSCTWSKPSQVSVSADLTLSSDSAYVFNAKRVGLECCVDLLRPAITASGAVQHSSSFPTTYLTRGNPTATSRWRNTDGAMLLTRRQYDDAGNVLSSTDPNSNSTLYSYKDAWTNTVCQPTSGQTKGYLTQITNALLQTTSSAYDSCAGLVGSATDSNNQSTTQTYDLFRRPLISTRPDGGQTTISYDDTNLIVTTSNLMMTGSPLFALDHYDQFGQQIEHDVCEDGTSACVSPIETKFSYDGIGRLISRTHPCRPTSDPTCGTTQFQYDVLDRQILLIPPDGSPSANNVTTKFCGNATLVTDQALKWRRSISDALGRLVEADEPNSPSATVTACPLSGDPIVATTYDYDTLGNLTGVLQGGSRQRTSGYDSLSELLSATDPESGSESYTYDSNGNMLTKMSPAPNQINTSVFTTTTYKYDSLNRILSKTYSGGAATPTVNYTYDVSSIDSLTNLSNTTGRLVKASSGTTAISYTDYDKIGRVADKWECAPVNCGSSLWHLSCLYDKIGNLTSYTNGVGLTITQAFDAADRLTKISSSLSDSNHPATLISVISPSGYWSDGELRQTLQGNGLTETWAYNNRHEPCRMNLNSTATVLQSCSDALPSGNVLDYTYGYADSSGRNNGTTLLWSAAGAQTFSRNYTYDQVSRLATLSGTGTTCSALTWTYDIWGNRTDQTNTPGSGSSCVEAHLTFTAQNRITAPNMVYDAPGNLMMQTGATYQYDDENRMTSLTGTGGAASYVYDAAGQRVQKTVQGVSTYYIYDLAGSVVAESNAATGWQKAYVYGGARRLLAEYDGGSTGTTSFVTGDYLGSTRLITALNQSVKDSLDFLPYGEQIAGDTSTTHKFTGKERDAESNLDDFGARYYSSSMGTFMSVDPSGKSVHLADPQTRNRYVYARDNPIGYVDPNGRWGTAVHNAIIDNALSFLASGDRNVVKAASLEVDQDQSVQGAYKHGMSQPPGPGQTQDDAVAAAMSDAGKWIDGNLDSAVNAQLAFEAAGDGPENQEMRTTLNSPDALRLFGLAAHTVADETSPEHAGFQPWYGYGDGTVVASPIPTMMPGYYPSRNDRRAGAHVAAEFIAGFLDPADQEQAVQNVHNLWVQYQIRLEEARKRKKAAADEMKNRQGKCTDPGQSPPPPGSGNSDSGATC
jgi:RHS repeat-associated protein